MTAPLTELREQRLMEQAERLTERIEDLFDDIGYELHLDISVIAYDAVEAASLRAEQSALSTAARLVEAEKELTEKLDGHAQHYLALQKSVETAASGSNTPVEGKLAEALDRIKGKRYAYSHAAQIVRACFASHSEPESGT